MAKLNKGKMRKEEIPKKGERTCPRCKGIIHLDSERDRNNIVIDKNVSRNRYYHDACAIAKHADRLVKNYRRQNMGYSHLKELEESGKLWEDAKELVEEYYYVPEDIGEAHGRRQSMSGLFNQDYLKGV